MAYYNVYYSKYRNNFILKSTGDHYKYHIMYHRALGEVARLNEKTFWVQDVNYDFKADEIEKLNILLNQAIEEEDYVKAANIRDQIQKIQNKNV